MLNNTYFHFIIFLIILPWLLISCTLTSSESTQTQNSTIFVTVTPSPTPPLENLVPYQQTMLPTFIEEVNQQAAKHITRYKIKAILSLQNLSTASSPSNIVNQPTIAGNLEVNYTNTETVLLNQIYFRLFPNTPAYGGTMAISDVLVNDSIVQFNLLAQDSTLEVPLPHTLAPGQQVKINLTYQATIPLVINQGYGLYAYQNSILTLAGFYPTIPVFDNQGWHIELIPTHGDSTYTDVALYDVTFTAPADMVIVTSGEVQSTIFGDDNTQTIQAYSGPMRDFFIAMSPRYEHLSQTVDGITVNSYFLSGNQQGGQFMLEVATNALRVFNQYFGPYPYRSFDVLEAPMPQTLGGVEFPGLIAMAQRYYTLNNEFAEFVVAHEVAHQWWYGLVGNDQVNTPWLDEALTQYSAIHYFEQRYGLNTRPQLVERYFTTPYQLLLNTNTNRPVSGPVADFSETAYSTVVYGKGPLFFENLRQHLGDPRYFAALRTYAQTYRYGIATPDDFLAVFPEDERENVNFLYQLWIEGE